MRLRVSCTVDGKNENLLTTDLPVKCYETFARWFLIELAGIPKVGDTFRWVWNGTEWRAWFDDGESE